MLKQETPFQEVSEVTGQTDNNNSGITNAGTINGATNITLDPDSSIGGALIISNTSNQTSGNLVEIEGTSSQTALNVTRGDTVSGGSLTVSGAIDNNNSGITNTGSINGATNITLDPDTVDGNALVISNNSTQTSGNLVEIDGTSGQTALNVKTGDTILGGNLEVIGQIDNNNSGITNAGTINGATNITLDPRF